MNVVKKVPTVKIIEHTKYFRELVFNNKKLITQIAM